jgi:peptidoglycan/xylan/chitin deacetylase (PgdA/CDA1 family)
VLYQCSTPNTIALTFDDGPWAYTQSILDTLANYNVHATFFITGNNGGKGRIDDPTTPWPAILKSMHAAGHQLASHTWSHEDLTAIPANLVQNQIIYNEMAFRNIFGWVPTYLRPPYGSCDDASTCLSTLNSLGYHIITWDVDTKDYLNDDPTLIQNSKNWFAGNVSNPSGGNSYIELSHDIHQQTALTLVSFMLDTLIARGYKAVAVGECMGDPSTNWYRDAGGVPASLSPSPTVSPSPILRPSPVANTVAETNATTTTSTSNKPVSTGLGVTALAASSPSGNAGISIVTHSLTSGSSSISTAVATNVTKSEASVKQISIWLYGLLWACSVITALGMGA